VSMSAAVKKTISLPAELARERGILSERDLERYLRA